MAVLDADAKRRNEAFGRFGCRGYIDFTQFLQDDKVEVVVLALPTKLHASCSIQALKAGKHVVCEKPMATGLQDADAMIACARRSRRVLAPFQNRRYDPDFMFVRKVIGSGVLGRIVLIRIAYHVFGRRWDWQTLKRFGGGTLYNTVPHPLDQALRLFGDTKPRVFCQRDRTLTLGDADDHVKIILSGRNAPTVEIEVTAACAYRQAKWLVMGTRGGLIGTGNRLRKKYFAPSALPKRKVDIRPTPDRSYNREAIPWIESTWRAPRESRTSEALFYIDLYKTIRHRKPLTVTPDSVRRQIWVLEQCRKQAPI